MSKLGISTGSTPNDGTGDTLLSAALKINSNFNEIYNAIGDGTNLVGVLTTGSLVGYATEGYVDDSIVGFITSGALSGYATEDYVDNLSYWKSQNSGIHTLSKVGIGTTNPTSALTVQGDVNIAGVSTFSGDVRVGVSTASGIILTSPNGTQYRLIVENNGSLNTILV